MFMKFDVYAHGCKEHEVSLVSMNEKIERETEKKKTRIIIKLHKKCIK